jgi:hypothetical protein
MPDLETLLRETRPAPDPAWAARMDARAAAGFPSPPPRWRIALTALRDHFLALSAVGAVASVLIVLVVVGVQFDRGGDDSGVGGSGEATTASGGASGTEAPASAQDSAGSSGSGVTRSPAPSTGGDAAAGDDRAVLRNASITLSTRPDQVESTVDRTIRIVDALGGYVQSSEVNRGGSSASATLVLKIPSADLDKGLAQISKLAHVRSRSQQAEDVTNQRSALEASVRDARADRDGLRDRLRKAATDRERSRLRGLLDRASRRVTQRERDLAQLGREVSYATVELSVEGNRKSGAAAAPGDRWTPGDAAGDAVRVLEVIAGVLVIGLAILVPIALLAFLAALAARVLRQHKRERALESA